MTHSIKTIFSLQLLRYLAAIIVVGYHTEESLRDRTLYDIYEFFSFGSIGVDIFFVISGFIIALTTSKVSEKTSFDQAKNFAIKRCIRIVPIYWFYTALKVLMVLLLPALALRSELQVGHLASSFFFIPDMASWGLVQPILPVGWTLNFEMLFYVIFTIAILINQNKILVTLVAFCSIFVTAHWFPNSLAFEFYAQSIIFEFLLGLIIFEMVKRIKTVPFWLNMSFLLLSIFLLNSSSGEINHIFTIGLGAFFLVFSVIYFERHLQNKKIQRVSEVLGDSSYSLYLSHSFTVPFGVIVFGQYLDFGGYFTLILTLILATLVGIASYRMLEKPMIRYLNQKWQSKRLIGAGKL